MPGFIPPDAPVGPGPVVTGAAVTPADATVLSPTRYLYVGGDGDLVVLLARDTDPVTLMAVPAGTMLALSVVKVMSATTASDIVAFR